MGESWRRGPFGPGAERGATIPVAKRILVVFHHLTAVNRLADVLTLIERDHRVQVVCTVVPSAVLAEGAARHLRGSGAVGIPWAQAVNTRFDLAVAAGYGELEALHAPVVIVPHGVGPSMLSRQWEGHGPVTARPAAGLRPETLVGGGRVIPSLLAAARDSHRDRLLRYCPELAPVVRVTGDPALDRMLAGGRLRETYREALGVRPGRRLVVVSSTWGPRSLLGRHPDLPARLAAALPEATHRVVMAVHPAVWAWHGRHQVLAWLEGAFQAGLAVLPPEEGWSAALVAADEVVGDFGSVTCYAAALGLPVTLAAFPDTDVVPGEPGELLGREAARLDPDAAVLLPDARLAGRTVPGMPERLTSRPGASARLLRRAMYELIGLPEPECEARFPAPAVPRPIGTGLLR
ncbi:hypothetical protein GCM10009550_05310 [Actinocorallia libanotica]|uniref:CDP-glycerol:poly(Glycerophosphate) glycerophosphotransferase n=1 Tax=Actinocorallia libanotica TaxID=46162 RepID=A0ABN1Q6Y7_9ACTN